MARRRRPAEPVLEDAPPEWLFRFQLNRWLAEHGPDSIEDYVKARKDWRKASDAWLAARGLVVWGMPGVTWQEYRRILREEPHRVLKRPADAA